MVKLSMCRPLKHMAHGGITPHILNVGTRWKRVFNFTILPITSGKGPPVRTEFLDCVDPRTGLKVLVKIFLARTESRTNIPRYSCP